MTQLGYLSGVNDNTSPESAHLHVKWVQPIESLNFECVDVYSIKGGRAALCDM